MRYFKKNDTLYASEFPPKNMDGVIEISQVEYCALLPIPEKEPEIPEEEMQATAE